jgi:hypothetical protein
MVKQGRPCDPCKNKNDDIQTQVLDLPYGELAPYFFYVCNTLGGNVIFYIHTTPSPPGFEVHPLTLTRQSCKEIDVLDFSSQ